MKLDNVMLPERVAVSPIEESTMNIKNVAAPLSVVWSKITSTVAVSFPAKSRKLPPQVVSV